MQWLGTGIITIFYDIVIYFGRLLGQTQSNCSWFHPSLDFKPWMVECCWPTLASSYFSQNPFLLWQSLRPYFSCQFTSRPGVSQLAFLNHRPQPESHRALYPLNNFSQKKSQLSPRAKTATSHMHIKFLMHGRATKDCMERKDQRTKLSFCVLIWCFEGKLCKVRPSFSHENVLADNESANGLVLREAAATLGQIYLSLHSLCFTFSYRFLPANPHWCVYPHSLWSRPR